MFLVSDDVRTGHTLIRLAQPIFTHIPRVHVHFINAPETLHNISSILCHLVGNGTGCLQHDMRHEMLTKRALFLPLRQCKKGHAESAFCDACRTSSESTVREVVLVECMEWCSVCCGELGCPFFRSAWGHSKLQSTFFPQLIGVYLTRNTARTPL